MGDNVATRLGDGELLATLCRHLAQVAVALDSGMERCRVCDGSEACDACVEARDAMFRPMMCVTGWYAAGVSIPPRDLLHALIRGGHVERLVDALRAAIARCQDGPCPRCTVGTMVLAKMSAEAAEIVSALRTRN